MEATLVSINRGDKDEQYECNYYWAMKNNEILPFATTWIDHRVLCLVK